MSKGSWSQVAVRDEPRVTVVRLLTPGETLLQRSVADELFRALEGGRARGCPVVLFGNEQVFAAGPPAEFDVADARAVMGLLARLSTHAPPAVAAVRGCAIGWGLGLATACSRTVAAPGASFAMGLATASAVAQSEPMLAELVHRIGRQPASWLAYSSQAVDAETAREMGIVHEVSESDESLAEEAISIAVALGTE